MFSAIMKRLMNARCVDLVISVFCVMFMGSLVSINVYLSSSLSRKQEIKEEVPLLVREPRERVAEVLPSAPRRVRRQADTWTIPADPTPAVLGVPFGGCTTSTILSSSFPNATCFAECTSGSCSGDDITNIQNGNAELVCTARVIHLGVKRTGAYTISKWIKAHSNVESKTGLMFADNFAECPAPQFQDVATSYHFDSYSLGMIGQSQKNLFIHCEECLNSGLSDSYLGSLFLDLPTGLLQYVYSPAQKFVITLKNPTDRAIAEYFYPYVRDGIDLSTVGGSVMHTAFENATTQAKDCMAALGPTACVYGVNPSDAGDAILAETTMLYESCYSTRMAIVTQQINITQIYFLKYEEYGATPETEIQSLFNFIGLDYEGPITIPTGTSVHKPILTTTVEMLDAFFAPFNAELEAMLGNSKWAFSRT